MQSLLQSSPSTDVLWTCPQSKGLSKYQTLPPHMLSSQHALNVGRDKWIASHTPYVGMLPMYEGWLIQDCNGSPCPSASQAKITTCCPFPGQAAAPLTGPACCLPSRGLAGGSEKLHAASPILRRPQKALSGPENVTYSFMEKPEVTLLCP